MDEEEENEEEQEEEGNQLQELQSLAEMEEIKSQLVNESQPIQPSPLEPMIKLKTAQSHEIQIETFPCIT